MVPTLFNQIHSENASYSTEGKLIAPGIMVPGTISITASDIYFDADEENPLYKKQDPKVGQVARNPPCVDAHL